MNDDLKEKLSAYLDGALTDQERQAVEVEISRSEEMRLELESLRAVSKVLKSLPKEPLPVGFMARLEARRALDSKARHEYFLLPPAYRPLAFALSTAVVALVVWDKTHAPEELISPKVGWDGDRVAVKTAADAPPSIDVSGQLTALGKRGQASGAAAEEASVVANELSSGKIGALSTFGKHLNAPGKPLEVLEESAPAETNSAASVAAAGSSGFSIFRAASAPSAATPAQDRSEPGEGQAGALTARNEEERSAINERLYKGFEKEKKRMGIAKIMDKDDSEDRSRTSGGREFMALQATPESPSLDLRAGRSVAAVRGVKAKTVAVKIKAIALRSPDALYTAWAAAGLPGPLPTVRFPEEMAVFLAGPAGCGIVSVQNRKKFVVVLYKDSGFDDASSRVRAVPLSQNPVVVKLAE